ncbi:MAG: hypothetical protein MJ233_03740 [Mycoplasmoidaceae bacterium]|nr:hypothetical protein [Mycoplasmoidaceae bacterium]
MNRNDLAQYDATVVTSRDFYEKIKPIFSMDSDATKAAGVRVGLSNKTLTRKYIGAGSTSYITPDDFIYLRPSACIDEPESEPENQSNKATMAYTYRDEDQSDFL